LEEMDHSREGKQAARSTKPGDRHRSVERAACGCCPNRRSRSNIEAHAESLARPRACGPEARGGWPESRSHSDGAPGGWEFQVKVAFRPRQRIVRHGAVVRSVLSRRAAWAPDSWLGQSRSPFRVGITR